MTPLHQKHPPRQPVVIMFINEMYHDPEQLADEVFDPWTTDVDDVPNHYKDAAERYLEVISAAMTYVCESGSPEVSAWACVYGLGLPLAAGVSLTDRAASLGVSVGALSKNINGNAFKILKSSVSSQLGVCSCLCSLSLMCLIS